MTSRLPTRTLLMGRLRAVAPEAIVRRVQLLCLALALINVGPLSALLLVQADGPWPLAAGGQAALALVGGLWLRTYRRGVPGRLDAPFEALALGFAGLAIGSTSAGATAWITAVFMGVVFHSLYGGGRRVGLWTGLYLSVQLGVPGLALGLGLEGFYARDLAANVIGLAFCALVVWQVARSLRGHERALESERGLREELAHRAHHDDLTGLGNRALFFDRIEHALALARRESTDTALLFLDLDGFKAVNDTLGHGAGDEVLRTVALRLLAQVRAADTVARIGGDEFVLLLEATSGAEARTVADQVLAALETPVSVPGGHVVPRASVGLAVTRAGRADADGLLNDADQDMYRAKVGRGAGASLTPRAA